MTQRPVGQLDRADRQRCAAPRRRRSRSRRRRAPTPRPPAAAPPSGDPHHPGLRRAGVAGRPCGRRPPSRCGRPAARARSVSWWLSGWPSRWAPHTASRMPVVGGAGPAPACPARRPRRPTRPRSDQAGPSTVTPNGQPVGAAPDGHGGGAPVEQVAPVGEPAERGVRPRRGRPPTSLERRVARCGRHDDRRRRRPTPPRPAVAARRGGRGRRRGACAGSSPAAAMIAPHHGVDLVGVGVDEGADGGVALGDEGPAVEQVAGRRGRRSRSTSHDLEASVRSRSAERGDDLGRRTTRRARRATARRCGAPALGSPGGRRRDHGSSGS